MTQIDLPDRPHYQLDDIIAADERAVPFGKRLFNGMSGAVLLLLGGLLVLVVVLWKAP